MHIRPFFLFELFLEMSSTGKPNKELLNNCLNKLSIDDIQFKH